MDWIHLVWSSGSCARSNEPSGSVKDRLNLKAVRLLGTKEWLYSSELVEIRLTMQSLKLLKYCVVIMSVTVIALGSANSERSLSARC